ncbi:MAG: AAA family ATPase [Verrucomicrobia bacterium]|nr:AAA family ATPase [Verrucomicrobiota bacterium]
MRIIGGVESSGYGTFAASSMLAVTSLGIGSFIVNYFLNQFDSQQKQATEIAKAPEVKVMQERIVKLQERWLPSQVKADIFLNNIEEVLDLELNGKLDNFKKLVETIEKSFNNIVGPDKACLLSDFERLEGYIDCVEKFQDDSGIKQIFQRIEEKKNKNKSILEKTSDKKERVQPTIEQLTQKTLELEEILSKSIVGQPAPAKALAEALSIRMSGLDDPNKPMARFLFVGPTGVGKTEVAKILARDFFCSPNAILSINVPEYRAEWDISRLIGASPGYIGHDDGGLLTNFVKNNPYAVILVDEIEKGTKAINDLFLKILDEGEIDDAQGERCDFKNTIIIFTSNIGAAEDRIDKAVKEYFRPEFLGRLNGVVKFNPLSLEMVRGIVDLELQKVEARAKSKGKSLLFTDGLKNVIYDETFAGSTGKGAREVRNIVFKQVIVPLAKKMLTEEADVYNLDMQDGKLVIL